MPKTLCWACLFGAFSFFFCWALGPAGPKEAEKVRVRFRNEVTLALAAYTGIMATLLAFRLNQGYSRYQECVACLYQMRAKWFNAVSTAFAVCTTEDARQSEVKEFQGAMSRLVSWLYWASLHQLEEKRLTLEILDTRGMEESKLNFLDGAHDQLEVLMHWTQRLLFISMQNGTLAAPPPIITRIFQELGHGVFEFNNIRKIRDIPIPYPYSQMVSLLLFFHVTFTAVAAAFMTDRDLVAFFITFLSVMANVGAYYISHEIERPFGSNMNDLPMEESMNWMNRSLSLILDPEVQQPPKFSSGCRDRAMTFKIYETFVDCHRKSTINMDAYDAVVHDFENVYDLVGDSPQVSRSSQDCISFSPTSRRSLAFRGRSLDSDVELTSMQTLNSPMHAHAHSEQPQSAVDDSTQAENIGRVPTLAARGSTAFANAATADAGRVPLLRSSGGPLQEGWANAAAAEAGHAPLLQSSGGAPQEHQANAAAADAGQAPLVQSSCGPLQEHLANAAPVDAGQTQILQSSSGPLQAGLRHAASADFGRAPSVQSNGESVQAVMRHAGSHEIQNAVSPANEDHRPDVPAGFHR